MYFSEHNENIVYINHYSGLLEVEGEGVLCLEDTKVSPVPGDDDWASEYNTLSITEGIRGIEEGYLDFFSNIDCLIFSRSVSSVAVTEELKKKYRKNKVLIRGEYDTYAEDLAKELGLKFLHCDIHIADDDIEKYHEHDIITLRFHPEGLPDIHYNCFTPGSSAGSYGGGEVVNELAEGFYVGYTIEKFAANFPERLQKQILSNDMLRRFLKISNDRYTKERSSTKKKK